MHAYKVVPSLSFLQATRSDRLLCSDPTYLSCPDLIRIAPPTNEDDNVPSQATRFLNQEARSCDCSDARYCTVPSVYLIYLSESKMSCPVLSTLQASRPTCSNAHSSVLPVLLWYYSSQQR